MGSILAGVVFRCVRCFSVHCLCALDVTDVNGCKWYYVVWGGCRY